MKYKSIIYYSRFILLMSNKRYCSKYFNKFDKILSKTLKECKNKTNEECYLYNSIIHYYTKIDYVCDEYTKTKAAQKMKIVNRLFDNKKKCDSSGCQV